MLKEKLFLRNPLFCVFDCGFKQPFSGVENNSSHE